MAASAWASSSQGVYFNALGGLGYLSGSKLSSMQMIDTDNPGNPQITPSMNKGSLDSSGRAALGYNFYANPLTSWAYGVELGYNYLSPATSALQGVYNPGEPYDVNANAKTNAWSSDLVFVANKGISKNVSLFGKLGMAYEDKNQSITSTIQGQGSSSASGLKVNNTQAANGVGGVAGFGAQYALSKNIALQTEFDVMKGGSGIGYAQVLAGLSFSF